MRRRLMASSPFSPQKSYYVMLMTTFSHILQSLKNILFSDPVVDSECVNPPVSNIWD